MHAAPTHKSQQPTRTAASVAFVRTAKQFLICIYSDKAFFPSGVACIKLQLTHHINILVLFHGLLLNLLATPVTLGWGWHAAPTYLYSLSGVAERLQHTCTVAMHAQPLEREREMLPTSSQKGLSRVGHERPLNTNSCADQPTNKRRVHESCIRGNQTDRARATQFLDLFGKNVSHIWTDP